MPKRACLVRAFLIALVAGSSVTAAFAQAPGGLDRLSWLAGCWAHEGAEAGSEEHWTQPAGGTMLGMGRTVKAGKTVEFEFLRIHVAPDGRLLFTAVPSGQKEATFTELRGSASAIVFENQAHDFPQRVSYRPEGEMRLIGSIAGTRNGAVRTIEFPMRRIECER